MDHLPVAAVRTPTQQGGHKLGATVSQDDDLPGEGSELEQSSFGEFDWGPKSGP